MSIKCPGHVPETTITFGQQCSSNVQRVSRTLQLYLGNNVDQMSIACTGITTEFRQKCPSNVQVMFLTQLQYLGNNVLKCPGHVPDITTIFTIFMQ